MVGEVDCVFGIQITVILANYQIWWTGERVCLAATRLPITKRRTAKTLNGHFDDTLNA